MLPLPYARIIAINSDILKWMEVSKKNTISGAGLRIVYKHNGVESPFDDWKQYRIFTKEGNHVLVTEITETIAA